MFEVNERLADGELTYKVFNPLVNQEVDHHGQPVYKRLRIVDTPEEAEQICKKP